jgi:hypothetical protein
MQLVKNARKQFEEAGYKGDVQKLKQFHRNALCNKFCKNSKSVYFQGKKILSGFHRIVIGAHGAYIEFSAEHFVRSMNITKGEEWRLDSKYKVKYLHMNPVGMEDLKVYKQTRTVNYADYRPGYYYVDFWEVELRDE